MKLWPGKSEQQKTRLAPTITNNVMGMLHDGDASVSVAIEEIQLHDWVEKVFPPDRKTHWDKLYKKPRYDEEDG